MKTLRYIIVILFITISGKNYAQDTAEDIFHLSANLYINGNSNAAKMELDRGLKIYPNDKKLAELRLKIKEEQKQKSDQQQNNDKQDNKENSEKDKQQNQSQEQNQGDKNQSQMNQAQEKQEEQQKEQSQMAQQGDENDDEKKEGQAIKEKDGEMSKEDAERILFLIEQQEKETIGKVEKEKANARKVPVEKEW